MNQTILLVSFRRSTDAKATARAIVDLSTKLNASGVSNEIGGIDTPHSVTMSIHINNQNDALVTCELLRKLDTEGILQWEVAGPPCPDHHTLTTSAYDRRYGEMWKCFHARCRFEKPVSMDSYITMTGLLGLRRSNETVTGRMSVCLPPDPRRKEEPVQDAEGILSSFDYAGFEQALLYTYQHLVETPRNHRQFDDIFKAAKALQSGVPVAFEATPEGTDLLDEAVCRARSRNMAEGRFVVQYQPMAHVAPNDVLSMARGLKAQVAKVNAVKPTAAIGFSTEKSGIDLSFGWLHAPRVEVGEDRSQIEMAKAQMLGQAPKGATVMEIVAMREGTNKNGDQLSLTNLRHMGKPIGNWSIPPHKLLEKTVSPEVANKILDDYFKTWPDIPRQIPRQDSKNRNFAFLYGARDELVESLREEIKVLTNAARQRENDIAELEHENLDLKGKLRVTGDQLTIKSRKVSDIKELRRTADLLIRTVAGMNLQDQPLSVQREVKEALLAAMKALKGELE